MKRQVFNPYLPEWEYIPDGEPHVFEGRLYIYGSHDKFGAYQFCQNDYVSWSAPLDDLSDWTYGGVIYRRNQDPRNADGKLFLEAPDVAFYKGKYYLFYPLSYISSVGVAVSEKPCGPFEYLGLVHHTDGIHLGGREGDKHQFDPSVFIEGDNIWLYTGMAPTKKGDMRNIGSEVMRLGEDMLTIVEEPKQLLPSINESEGTDFEGHEFYEASSMRKIDGKYYFVYSSVLSHELCYAVSDYPDRDFRFGGTIVDIADVGYNGRTEPINPIGNTHGGLAEVNGQWYIFYHRQTNRSNFARQGCAERVEIKDGKISHVQVTSCGLNGGPLEGKGEYPARIACMLVGASGKNGYNLTEEMVREYMHGYHSELTDSLVEETKLLPYLTQDEPDGDGGTQYLKHMLNGACVGYRFFRFDGDRKLRVVTRGNGGKFIISREPNGKSVGEVCFAPSDVWKISDTGTLHLPAGESALYFTFVGEGETDLLRFILEK